MGIPQENILNLNKSRMRAVYWRPDGKGGWMQTMPLPADPVSISYYFQKGFKAKKPEEASPTMEIEEVKPPVDEHKCLSCGFLAKSDFGLKAHLRKHNKEKTK